VAPAAVTLVQGRSFLICDRGGEIEGEGPAGLFVGDRRVLSRFVVLVDGLPVQSLAEAVEEPFHARFVGRVGEEGRRPPLLVFRDLWVGRGLRADVTVRHEAAEERAVRVAVLVGSDLAVLFAVKEGRAGASLLPATIAARHIEVRSGDDGVIARPVPAAHLDRTETGAGVITWEVVLPPRGTWTGSIEVTAILGGEEVPPRYRVGVPVDAAVPSTRQAEWLARLPRLESDVDGLDDAVGRAGEDVGALRIFDPDHPHDPVVAAGAPWFMTLFGRDSLITSWMALVLDPNLALSTLTVLAELQGRRVVAETEEEPGRILHEVRMGEPATLSVQSGTIYYGSIDATPLFVMLVGELYRWGVPLERLRPLLPAVDAALQWMVTFGDRDGDGYVEYERATPAGLLNQGWKDSHDSISFADGRLAVGPIALAEVQAYAYAAWRAGAALAVADGRADVATDRQARADHLRRRFNADFWMPAGGTLAVALDGDKRQVDAVTSNMGHCLWTGIVDGERLPEVAHQLIGPELASGWGVRTLATSMGRYNPISYHNGSVWPHDTAIVTAGLRRAGYPQAANRLAQDLLRAAAAVGGRLPELYAGITPAELSRPVPYPTSCSPQAWAAAAPLLLLRTILGFEPDIPDGVVRVAPVLPDGAAFLHLARMPLAGTRVDIDVDGDDLDVRGLPEGVALERY
jgi:glycogen debranching enzyme